MVSAREVRELVEDRPDLERALEVVLEADSPWSFGDVDVDSGEFGELVSRGLVVEREDGYRIVDEEAVRRGLDGDLNDAESSERFDFSPLTSIAGLNRLEASAIIGAFLLVVLFRVTSFSSVFQADAVVLSSNDPYFYRYWLEQLLNDPETTLTSLPGGVTKGEPLLLGVLWLVTVTLGGTVETAGMVLAWYPVVSALVTAGIVYGGALLISDDRRVALASVVMLAVLPGHAFRTSLGFADHHAFDYPWVALTFLGAVVISMWALSNENRGTEYVVGGVAAVAVGVSAQTLAWDAGPLLIIPLGATIAVMAITAVYRDDSVLESTGPLVLGTVLAAGITWIVHSYLGWHTTLVAASPVLLAMGGILVVGAGMLWRRLELPVAGLPATEGGSAVLLLFVVSRVQPELWARFTSSFNDRLLARREIAEVQSLFSNSAGWLLLFGLLLLLALPYMAWASKKLIEVDRWTPLAVYAWYFFVLAVIQIRFAGQFSIFVAIFAGLGFVHLAEWIDIARRPAPFSGENIDSLILPDRRQAFALVGLFLLVAGLSMIQVPVKTSQITTSNNGYSAASWMADYSNKHDMEYPENYVFTQWGQNRMYNYFVSGQSQWYYFAQSNYASFVLASNGTSWYERLQNRVGFIVTTPSVVSNESTIGTRLHSDNGSRSDAANGLSHYRLVHVEKGGEYKVFTLVKGAVIRGEAKPNSEVRVRTTVELESYAFEYVRTTMADENGSFSIRVAHPGSYSVGDSIVEVSEDAVVNGSTVAVNSSASVVNRAAVPGESGATDATVSWDRDSKPSRFAKKSLLSVRFARC